MTPSLVFRCLPYWWWAWLLLVGPLVMSSCSDSDAPAAAAPEAVLRALVHERALPAMTRLAESAADLNSAVNALCERPSETGLKDARVAWSQAYLAWCGSFPYLFGPADDVAIKQRLGTWPVNEIVLERVVASDEFAEMRVNYDLRGFAAVEYLLFLPNGAQAATADQRCAHLKDISAQILDLSDGVLRRWQQDYGQAMAEPGTHDLAISSADHALALFFAEGMNLTERMLWQRVGIPSGFFRGAAKPEELEAVHAGLSRESLTATLEALHLLVDGSDGQPGLAAAVAGVDPARAADMVDHAERAVVALAPVDDEANEPLVAVLERRPTRLKALYRQVEALQDQLSGSAELLELPILVVQDGD